jgi:hypothetical protein
VTENPLPDVWKPAPLNQKNVKIHTALKIVWPGLIKCLEVRATRWKQPPRWQKQPDRAVALKVMG